ncbi:EAL and GGDEF domain-containing protein [Neptunomonas antarctica]|uniref:cyclic-guanylate-specific phosphodiesterase n=1 Tax=Neptunomonas antarctica TaxID=619304 RepID=A0A1N7LNW3_9GAMM|nr:EAL domain-containing protein [Neptunomonas antarctica]SIS75518.1 PAS domain S-box-containing protein/diguanylate cyclase (GGDEF) domain-containing protein [Neptunomonas antarctica]
MNLLITRLVDAIDQHVIVSVTDAAGKITYVNNKFCDVSGFSCDDVIGKTHRILHSGFQDAQFYQKKWSILSDGSKWTGVLCNSKKNGDLYWVDSTVSPVVNDKGVIENFISIQSEITDLDKRKQSLIYKDPLIDHGCSEECLYPDSDSDAIFEAPDRVTVKNNSELEFVIENNFVESLVDAVPTIFLLLDNKKRIIRFNAYMEEVSGYTLIEVVGRLFTELLILADDHTQIIEKFDSVLKGESLSDMTDTLVRKDGGLRKIQWHSKRLHHSNRSDSYILLTGQDITKRLEAENTLHDTAVLYQTLIESTNNWMWETDLHGKYTYVSPNVEKVLGFTPQYIINKSIYSLMSDAEVIRMKPVFLNIFNKQGSVHKLERIVLDAMNHEVVLEISCVPFFDSYGNFSGYRGVDKDITKCKQALVEYQLAENVLAQTPEAVMITDSQLKIIRVNAAFTRTTGYSETEVKGRLPSILSSNRHDQSFYQAMWASLNAFGQWQGEIWNRRKDGDIYPEWLNINSVKNDDGMITHYAGIFSDISNQYNVRQKLHDLAYYDALTGLPNRELFQNRLHEAIKLASRNNDKLAIIFLDLDDFKNINDSLGHRSGDQLLKVVADNISNSVRSSDTVARLGGDEFTIILSDIKRFDDITILAEKIIKVMNEPVKMPDGNTLYISASIGISIYPDNGDDVESLLKNADTAMYRAKNAGKKAFKFYTPEMSIRFNERVQLESELRRAIDKGDLSIVYQPQIDGRTGKILGFEALARWYHVQRGWVSPVIFIPIAEETGLIGKIGEWVLKEACHQLKKWQDNYSHTLKMAVNISSYQIHDKDMVEKVLSIINTSDILQGSLELELTETSLMDNIDSTISTLAELSKHGVSIAIDDFGTGYSSLGYLKRFKIDKLKIDKLFINDITTDSNDAEIVKTIISMAHNLNMQVIAEGVETEAQLNYLINNGCNEVQGFYFCAPKSPSVISAMLMKNRHILPAER